MKRTPFTEEQINGILREHEAGAATSDVRRKHGISSAASYKWKSKYGGLDVSQTRRLRSLEDENRRLKKLLAEAMLGNAMLKDIALKKMVTPAVKREVAADQCNVHGVSQRPARRAIGVDWALVRYPCRRRATRSSARLRELAAVRRRFGWRRLQVLLLREGVRLNHKKLRRLYVEERLQVRRRIGRKRAVVTRIPLVPAREPNQRWSMDFVHDALSDGRPFRIPAVVDDNTREKLCLADTSLPGDRVIRELEALVTRRRLPRQCVSDNGPEFAGRRCSAGRRVFVSTEATSIRASRSRTPSSKTSMALRDEFLNETLFTPIA